MKELFLLLALTFSPSAQVYSNHEYKNLWTKIEAAIEEGKPQTAANLLAELEQVTVRKKDTLEQLAVMKTKYECLSKYNWKDANKYYPAYSALNRRVMDNLDYYIEKYANHPRVDGLIYEKISRHKMKIDYQRNLSGKQYREIRRMCMKAVEVFPDSKYRNDFFAIVNSMDAKSAGISCEKTFIYPGDAVKFNLSGRNIDQSEFSVYRLNDRYEFFGSDPVKKISGNGRLVSKQKISSYKNDYNIPERIDTEFEFNEPGIYVVANSADGKSDMVQIYVSRVALASRQSDGKNEVYLADARSGKPFTDAIIYAWSEYFDNEDSIKDGFVHPSYISQKAYSLNGFTALTQNLFSKKNSSAQIAAEVSGDKWSPAVNVGEPYLRDGKKARSEQLHYIYTDRKLYRAGDTVEFKLIAMTTNYESGKVLSGKKITVSLFAPASDKEAAKVTLTTNSMGSAAGKFVIPKGSKNGSWRLMSERANAYFRVEAYKDPKFEIEMDKVEDIYTFEQIITQKGRVKGYTGEGISDARVEYTVESYQPFGHSRNRAVIAEGMVRTDGEGRFEIPFTVPAPADEEIKTVINRISVKAVSRGGETDESSKTVAVSRDALSFTAEFDNEYRMDTLLLVNKDKAETLTVKAFNADGVEQKISGWYRLKLDGEARLEDTFTFGSPVIVDLGSLPSGEYTLEYGANLFNGSQSGSEQIVLLSPNDRTCPVERDMFFYPVETKDAIDFVVGTSSELYLEVEIFDEGKAVYRQPLHLNKGAQHIKLDYKSSYGDKVVVSVFGVKNFREVSQRYDFSRTVPSENFEIKVSSLRDKTTPNTTETFTVEAPASEMLISIYDVTCDRYGKNNFYFAPIRRHYQGAPRISSNLYGGRHFYYEAENRGIMIRGGKAAGMVMMAKASTADMAADKEESAIMYDAVPEEAGAPTPSPEEIDAREDFSQTLAFIPQLQIPSSGKATVTFTTREGLSKFRIAMLAHTKDLRSGTAERHIIVNKPVKIESYAPLFAVEGDKLVLKATVTNTGKETVKGRASVVLEDLEDGLALDIYPEDRELTLKPDQSETVSWEIKIPGDVKTIGVTSSFAAKNGSDAEKRRVEVIPASRYITEAESFIIGQGRNKQSCIRDLKARFPYPDAEIRYEEYSTKEALLDVLKKPDYPKGDNMIEWLDALYVNQMRGCLLGADSIDVNLSRRAVARLEKLQKSDGGYGWFPCNSSSDLLTLMFLDKTYYMREVGKLPRNTSINKQIENALKYVDKRIFELTKKKKWNWRDLTYFFAARMEHPNFAMSKEVQNVLLEYLKRCKKDWKDIPIVEKAKLCTVLEATGENRQLFTVMNSLRDYAVRNDNIGCYFPNAVMPYRGLLHTELYAHSILAVIFAEMEQMDIAKGIMKWLLLQKHNQQWGSNMASADAIFALLKYRAPDLKFGAVYYTYHAPMLDVKESANQMSVKRSYYRDGKLLKDGATLNVGDKIEVRYDIYNSENRSFVVMEAARPACFYPVDERSYGSSWFYCERQGDHTQYYFQTLAEEDTQLRETFYVTQEGVFNTGLVEIESLYAPEYRGHTGAFKVEAEDF